MAKFLKLDKPCLEKWQNMKPNEAGAFCDLCSKSVIDFTQLNQSEIAEKMTSAKGNLCIKVTQKQLVTPLVRIEIQRKTELPYSNIAAGLILASALTVAQPSAAQNRDVQTEMVKTTDSVSQIDEHGNPKPKSKPTKSENLTTIKGVINAEKDGKPIEKAKIQLITLKKIFSAYSSQDGSYILNVPTDLIDDNNVIMVTYYETNSIAMQQFYNMHEDIDTYEEENYILTQNEINSVYKITAKPERFYLGGAVLFRHGNDWYDPIVIDNGVRIGYRNFENKYYDDNREYYNSKDVFHFTCDMAIAIYGKKRAKFGLYLLFDKPIE